METHYAPIRTAGGLLIDPGGRMLLGLRAPHKRVAPCHWDIVGGHVEPGETVEAALVREIVEELGVRPIRFSLLDALAEPSDGCAVPVIHHVYAITRWDGGSPRNACGEHSQIRWFTIGEIRALTDKTPFDFDALHVHGGEKTIQWSACVCAGAGGVKVGHWIG